MGAAMPIGLQRANAATKKDALELLDMTGGGGHDLKDSPSRGGFLPTYSALFARARRRVRPIVGSDVENNPGLRLSTECEP